ADHLGLDGQEVLAAYRARERAREEAPVAPRPQRAYQPMRLGPAIAGLVTAVVLVVCSLAAWQLGDKETPQPAAPQTPSPSARPHPAVTPATVALAATAASRVEIRFGGPRGRPVWSGTLRPG